ncbi:phosphate signaling complex protein PhoU [Peribacillus glennii]|uniref:Phosphate-specific transport system accessory protein PhoU n=1 Tax=Peribacillus glennii TaxID=2303991 RepID=A0A372LH06_9BACI|nr:phosphate signaling complex protein PhoU [Peribacillus glennii]RFU64896.1 phosphate transport system regulatory protein PhoU [Peribacillus glennii]
MPIREKFEDDLNKLQNRLLELGEFTNHALARAMEALETQNVELALEIMDDDTKADILEEEINDISIWLIAKQQPVAIDLRRIIAAIKIATDVERIADFAVNIAKSTIRIGTDPHVQPLDNIKQMHSIMMEMLRLSLEAFNEDDIEKAKQVADMDDQVDDLYGQTIRSFLSMNQSNPELLPQVTQLSFVCRFLERAADHCTNIAESVYYLVKGRRYDLNS